MGYKTDVIIVFIFQFHLQKKMGQKCLSGHLLVKLIFLFSYLVDSGCFNV